MQFFIKRSDILFLAVVSLCFGIFRQAAPEFALAAAFFIILAAQLAMYRRVKRRQERLEETISKKQDLLYKETEALTALYATQELRLPLPPMRGSAISPDFATILVSLITEKKPQVIVECGSGVSTIIAANHIKRLGGGHVYSIDHNEKYAELTRANLQLHELHHHAAVLYAPLQPVSIGGKEWDWYDTGFLAQLSGARVDMVIIDGPPREQGKDMVRYPALPLLYNLLSDTAVIVLDDTDREDEKKVIRAWLKEFNGLTSTYYPTEKGTTVIYRG